jgi:propanediol dehydratase small subunit
LDAKTTLFDFVLERAADEPVRRRIEIYRALAEYAGSAQDRTQLLAIADELEQAEANCREFTFTRTSWRART